MRRKSWVEKKEKRGFWRSWLAFVVVFPPRGTFSFSSAFLKLTNVILSSFLASLFHASVFKRAKEIRREMVWWRGMLYATWRSTPYVAWYAMPHVAWYAIPHVAWYKTRRFTGVGVVITFDVISSAAFPPLFPCWDDGWEEKRRWHLLPPTTSRQRRRRHRFSTLAMVSCFWDVSEGNPIHTGIIRWQFLEKKILTKKTTTTRTFFQSHCKCGKMTLKTNFCHGNHTHCINWKYEFSSFIESPSFRYKAIVWKNYTQ